MKLGPWLAPLVLAALLLAPGAAPQGTETERATLAAAVAPAQLAVDTAASIIVEAMIEADRDGSPDAAMALRDRLQAFVAPLDREWSLPPSVPHAAVALDAVAFAVAVADLVDRYPEHIGVLASAAPICGTPGEANLDKVSLGRAQAWLFAGVTDLEVLARDAPNGVETARLTSAAARLQSWLNGFTGAEWCDTPPFIAFRMQPNPAWPGAIVQVYGVTNEPGPIAVNGAGLAWSESILVKRGAFSMGLRVPPDQQRGAFAVHATTADAHSEVDLVVERAPVKLYATGPASGRAGATVDVAIRVASSAPLPVTSTVTAHDDATGTVQLTGAVGSFTWTLPQQAGLATARFEYPGSATTLPGSTSFTIRVLPPPALDAARQPDVETGRLGTAALDVLPWAAGAAVVLAIAVAAAVVWRRRRAPAPVATDAVDAVDAQASTTPSVDDTPPFGSAFVALFSWLAGRLRTRGELSPRATARDVGLAVTTNADDAARYARHFEEQRFGFKTPGASDEDAAKSWWHRAWDRLRGETG